MAFKGEDQHNPMREPLFRITGGMDEIRGLNDPLRVVKGLLGTL
jgi:hypothetical protein